MRANRKNLFPYKKTIEREPKILLLQRNFPENTYPNTWRIFLIWFATNSWVKMLNVNRSVQDAFYRYKMPRLQAKVEGKGNGVKTVIPNMVDIAKSLGRPPTCE